MTENLEKIDESISDVLQLLEKNNIFEEMEKHPLILLRDQLEKIHHRSSSLTLEDKRSIFFRLSTFHLNVLEHFLTRYSSQIPLSFLINLLDMIRFQIYFNLDVHPGSCDYYFDYSLTYLCSDTTRNYLEESQIMTSDMKEYFLDLFTSIGSHSVAIKTINSFSICVSRKNVPTFFPMNSSTERLLQSIVNYLNNYFLFKTVQSPSFASLLKWLVTMTEIYGFIPFFVKVNYPNVVLKWIEMKREETSDISMHQWFLVLNLIHNLARHWMGVKALNKLKAIDILKQWKEQYLSKLSNNDDTEYDKDILIAYYLVYSSLLEAKAWKKENITKLQRVLDYILERTIQAFNSPDFCSGPFNLCEYLNSLAKFIVNDTLLLYVISREEIFDLFLEKFLLFNSNCDLTDLNTVICSTLYSIFWSISFHSDFIEKIKSNENFVSLIDRTAKIDSTDEHWIAMKRAAKGILFNLDLIQTDIQPIEETSTDNDQFQSTRVMISYCHKDTTFCKKLVNALERFTGELWVDFKKLTMPYEDDWEEIAKAITQCDIIVMIVTENYCSSKSCRREVIHADKRNKRMIPVYQGRDYKPEDWFEIRVGSATWLRFGDKKTDDEVVESLLALISISPKAKTNVDTSQKSTMSSSSIVSNLSIEPSLISNGISVIDPPKEGISTQSTPISSSPVEQWTSEEVQQWLRLPSSILQLSSGRALLTYVNLLSNEKAQCDEYETSLRPRGLSREQFANLISSFSSLRSIRPIQTKTNELPKQWTQEQVRSWFENNQLSTNLFNTLKFQTGSQLITYAKLILHSSTRLDHEYDRLKTRIGHDLFHLDQYARFVDALIQLTHQTSKID